MPNSNETEHKRKKRRRILKSKIQAATNNKNVGSLQPGVLEEKTHQHSEFDFLHANPKVHEMVCRFNEGEMKHTIGMCNNCFEYRPLFHTTSVSNLFQNKSNPAEVPEWKLKDDLCIRCQKEVKAYTSLDDTKASQKVPKYSGINSAYLTKMKSAGKHNNMHFEKVPPFLDKLTFIEQLLIRKISVALYIHTLKYGILASKCQNTPKSQNLHQVAPSS